MVIFSKIHLVKYILKAILLVTFFTSSKIYGQDPGTKDEYTPAIYNGCEDIKDPAAQAECSEKTMYNLAYRNVVYPAFAKEEGISGTVIVTFDVNEKGEIEKIEVSEGAHEYLDNASIKAIKKLRNYYAPAYRNGIPVKEKKSVIFRFQLH